MPYNTPVIILTLYFSTNKGIIVIFLVNHGVNITICVLENVDNNQIQDIYEL